jgi:glycosyltransferase involved in cell wall biosynthesis
MVQTNLTEPDDNVDVTVSVHVITYNQKDYIGQALEGVLSQKTIFPIEIIVGDDGSTDGTSEIVQQYVNRYPSVVKPLFHPRNMGPEGMPGKNNFLLTLKACKGKYIALLDGDDYWCDDNKLQKQIDFLEGHSDYSICFHKAKIVYEGGVPQQYRDINIDTEETTTLSDLVKGNYIHASTCVFRRNFTSVPDWFFKVFTGDWALHMLNAEYGKLFFINEEMAAYRVHNRGLLSARKTLEYDLNKMETFKIMADHFQSKNSEAYQWFKNLHYHQKAFFLGIANVKGYNSAKRFLLLVRCGIETKKTKLFLGAFMALFLSGEKLQKFWHAASEKKQHFAL